MPRSGKCRTGRIGASWQAAVSEPRSACFHRQPRFVARLEMIMTQTFEHAPPAAREGALRAFVPMFAEQMCAQGYAPASMKASTASLEARQSHDLGATRVPAIRALPRRHRCGLACLRADGGELVDDQDSPALWSSHPEWLAA